VTRSSRHSTGRGRSCSTWSEKPESARVSRERCQDARRDRGLQEHGGPLFVAWDLSAVAAAWAMLATSMIIAAWVDGYMLGQALGIISVSTKVRRA
jgi:hypothetical protein